MVSSMPGSSARIGATAATLAHSWGYRLLLIATLVLSAFLELFRIDREGTVNAYYAAAVRSMLDNWRAFFFVSFDRSNFVSVDKPPLGLWLQTISAWLFGFHGWSILLPQIAATVASVWLLWYIVRRAFGPIAASIAAVALAVSPISVATGRNNTSDSVLTLLLMGAGLAISIAAERGSWRWMAGSMALVGLGFEIKMMQAYLVLPAIGLVYLLASGLSLRRKIVHLFGGGVLLATVSFAWAVMVDLVPAHHRPYVGSSSGDSVFNLIFGYNGVERLIPGNGFAIFGVHIGSASGGANLSSVGVGGPGENGATGPFRLVNTQLGGQVGWLLPFAIIGMLAAWGPVRSFTIDPARRQLVLWGTWMLSQAAFFSVANHFHRYYMTIMAPSIAALTGIGAVAMWRLTRQRGWRALVFPTAISVTVIGQLRILNPYLQWRDRIGPAIVILALTSVVGLLMASWLRVARDRALPRMSIVAVTAGLAALLIAPLTWSGITAAEAGHGPQPAGGPTGPNRFGHVVSTSQQPAAGAVFTRYHHGYTDPALIAYLTANKGTADWIVAVRNGQEADNLILKTNDAVMAIGGFSGEDPIITPDAFAALVHAGKLRFVLTGVPPSKKGKGSKSSVKAGGATDATQVIAWVTANCTEVPASTYRSKLPSHPAAGGSQNPLILYDCQGAAA